MSTRHELDIDASDPFLPAALGVISLSGRLESLLHTFPPPRGAEHATAATSDSVVLDAALGVVALVARIKRLLDEHASSPISTPTPANEAASTTGPLRPLLR
jgi:hypothetical protein